LTLSNLRSSKKVSIPAFARTSAAQDPAGPPPTTATRSAKALSPKRYKKRPTHPITQFLGTQSPLQQSLTNHGIANAEF
jgi:hypothetical protein